MSSGLTLARFIEEDNRRGLFPLRSTTEYVCRGEGALRKLVYGEILDKKDASISFAVSRVAYALKDQVHLRKTLVLDPVSSFFLYDFVMSNKAAFKAPPTSNRMAYGYVFRQGEPVSSFDEYHRFRRRKYSLTEQHRHFVELDIANCFNSFYHHDFVRSIADRVGIPESERIGQFLREINTGDSVNCFPQGVFPAKVLGNLFLRFIEEARRLRADAIVRFLDDIVLFSTKESVLNRDVLVLQEILGSHALALNAEKTSFGRAGLPSPRGQPEEIKKKLLRKREERLSYADAEDDEAELTEEEREYLRDLVGQRNAAEEDVELALSLLRDEPDVQLELSSMVLKEFPHLMKHLYGTVGDMRGYDGEVFSLLETKLRERVLSEYELFWLAKIAIDYYQYSPTMVDLLVGIYEHRSSTQVVRSAILETDGLDHGLDDMKVQALRDSPSGLSASSAIVGLEAMAKGKRNQIFKYVARGSRQTAVLTSIITESS